MTSIEAQEPDIVDDDADAAEDDSPRLDEYDIISSPNDFNTQTLISFIDKGFFTVPGFQRNYVWDIGRASRLIESLILGLPIPQVFLYEEGKNRFLLIDGQQRLMSLYFFAKKRFPRKEKRPELRTIVDANSGLMPNSILEDDKYFQRFNLYLPSSLPNEKNPLHGLNHATLGDKADTFDFRTIRSISIKQLSPEGDSSVFEIFNRLNSGGVNLRPQEMRSSLYHSEFFSVVHRLNSLDNWRATIGIPHPDVRMKDSEVLLRALAMVVRGDTYRPSMVRFLNRFSKDAKQDSPEEIALLEAIAKQFLTYAVRLGPAAFQQQSTRLSVPLFEAVFYGCCRGAYEARDSAAVRSPTLAKIEALKKHEDFLKASRSNSADTANVRSRLELALRILGGA